MLISYPYWNTRFLWVVPWIYAILLSSAVPPDGVYISDKTPMLDVASHKGKCICPETPVPCWFRLSKHLLILWFSIVWIPTVFDVVLMWSLRLLSRAHLGAQLSRGARPQYRATPVRIQMQAFLLMPPVISKLVFDRHHNVNLIIS